MLRSIKEVFLILIRFKMSGKKFFFCFLGNENWSQLERINNKSLQNKSDSGTKYTNTRHKVVVII